MGKYLENVFIHKVKIQTNHIFPSKLHSILQQVYINLHLRVTSSGIY